MRGEGGGGRDERIVRRAVPKFQIFTVTASDEREKNDKTTVWSI